MRPKIRLAIASITVLAVSALATALPLVAVAGLADGGGH
jgi:hypothetical protein